MLNKKLKLALTSTAVGAVLAGSSMGAYAFNAAYSGTEPAYAQNLVGIPAAVVSDSTGLAVNSEVGDLILGRTTGFGIRITLNSGTFAGSALAAVPAFGGTAAATWSVSSVSVGATAANIVFSPDATPDPLIVGDLITLAAGDLDVTAVDTTLGAGVDVTALVEFYDPVTAAVLLSDTVTLFQAAEGTATTYTSEAIPTARIDVGDLTTPGKTDFSSPGGSINALTAGDALTLTKHLGNVTAALSSPVATVVGTSASNTTFAGWAAGTVFNYNTAVDTISVTVTGDDLTAFNNGSIWVEAGTAGTCLAGPGLASVTAGVLAGGATASSATSFAFTLPLTSPTSTAFDICATADGVTEIDDQVILASSQINLDPTNTTAGGVVSPAATGPTQIADLQFNGDVFDIHHVNPTTQTTNVSVIRVSNTGATGGKVTLTAVDDAGVAGTGTVSFTLDSGESVQLNINELEVVSGTKTTPNGNAVTGAGFGDGTGKWRVRVTAEYAGLKVTNKNNNINGGSNNYTADSTFK